MNFLLRYAPLLKWAGILIVIGAIAFAVHDYIKSKEQIEQLILNNAALEQRIESIKEDIMHQAEMLNNLSIDYNKIEIEYSRQVEKIEELRKLTEDYIRSNAPKVKQELNEKFKQTVKEIQCLTGDKLKCD